MMLKLFTTLLWSAAALLPAFALFAAGPEEVSVRTSPIAGSWYPGDTAGLEKMVRSLLNKVSLPEITGRPLAVIAPHAGIQFSGQAAAYAFKVLEGRTIRRVLLLGPSHHLPYRGIATSGVSCYETPLGKVPVDSDLSDTLRRLEVFSGPREAELPEHSLEMELPFLQIVLDDFKLVPLVVGDMTPGDYEKAAEELRKHIDTETVIVVSSDFTHYGRRFGYLPFTDNIRENLKKLDGGALDKIIQNNCKEFLSYVDTTGATICGARPIALMLHMLPPSARGMLLHYYTSGDLLHDYKDTVSYASVVFTAGKKDTAP